MTLPLITICSYKSIVDERQVRPDDISYVTLIQDLDQDLTCIIQVVDEGQVRPHDTSPW